MDQILNVLQESYNTFFNQMAGYLPSLIGAIVILIVGWIIAKIVRAAAVRLLKLIRLDKLTEKTGIDDFLSKGNVAKSSIQMIGSMFYWLVLLIVILTALNSLGLSVASALFNQIILFIPNIIIAVLVLIFGLALANFVSQVMTTYLKNIEVKNSDQLSKLPKYAIIIFAISISLTQLKIGEELVGSAFLMLFGSTCLALALAFGLGGREWAAKVIDSTTNKLK